MNELLPLAVVLCVGIFTQAASGFAAGLLIVTLLVWIGYPIPEAQVSLIIATIPQNLWGVWKLRDAISLPRMAWPAVGRLAALPLGVATLSSLELLSADTIKQIVAGIVLVITLAICLLNPVPREKLHWGWGAIAFPLSGFLQGLVGMGGPAMVLWVQAHDWDTRRSRAFLFTMYLISLGPAYIVLWLSFGERLIRPTLFAAALTPLLLLITSLGLKAGTRLGRKRLRRLTLGLLIAMGTMGLVTPWLSHWYR